MSIVTYYFDSIPLNWRERRVMMDALDKLIDAHEDAYKLATAFAVVVGGVILDEVISAS
ncbi:hypothetical protein D3C87_2119700 [compost metagenome]